MITHRNDDRKSMQPTRPAMRMRKWKRFSQFRRTSTKVVPIDIIHFNNKRRVQERDQGKDQRSGPFS